MDNYIDPKMKAAKDFHSEGIKNNTYAPGTMCHKQYEAEWQACFDQESKDARQELEVICG